MLTREAQPTSCLAISNRVGLRAACGVLAVAIAIIASLVLPVGGAAAGAVTDAWPWPLLGEVITPYKNGSDPYAAGQHRGLDIAAPVGSPVLAIAPGRVSFSGTLPDGGAAVTIKSTDGEWLISHLHLSRRDVARGQAVRVGELLGEVGVSGRRSASAPHLHLGVRQAVNGAYVDPLAMLGEPLLAAAPAVNEPPAIEAAAPAELASAQQTSVHAQQTGDSTPAKRHGAVRGPVAARRSAGTTAREGHAAQSAQSRVAPPPLTANPGVTTTPQPTRAITSRPVAPRAAPSRQGTPSRLLLLAVTAICALALFIRRRPVGSTIQAPRPSGDDAGADDRPTGEVIAIEPLRRASGGR